MSTLPHLGSESLFFQAFKLLWRDQPTPCSNGNGLPHLRLTSRLTEPFLATTSVHKINSLV